MSDEKLTEAFVINHQDDLVNWVGNDGDLADILAEFAATIRADQKQKDAERAAMAVPGHYVAETCARAILEQA